MKDLVEKRLAKVERMIERRSNNRSAVATVEGMRMILILERSMLFPMGGRYDVTLVSGPRQISRGFLLYNSARKYYYKMVQKHGFDEEQEGRGG